MGVYIEALILYVLLFLSGSIYRPGGFAAFSIVPELARIFLYNAPALALIWYLLLKVKNFREWGVDKPGKKDLFAGFLALPCLLLAGFSVTFVSSFFDETAVMIPTPTSVPSWIVLGFSCISTGYLEESFFRFYLLSKRKEFKLSDIAAVTLSTALFSICHIYEGPWGFLNSVISGVLLSFIFLRYKSLHGIAIAHGLYNLIAYVTMTN